MRKILLFLIAVLVALFLFPATALAADGLSTDAAVPALQSIAVIVAIVKMIRLRWSQIDGLTVGLVAVVAGIGLNLAVYAFASSEWFGFAAKGLIDALSAVGVFTVAQAMAPAITTNIAPANSGDFVSGQLDAVRQVVANSSPQVRPERPRDVTTGRFTSADRPSNE